VAGGPAPGINSVICSATIRGVLAGAEVVGIRDGFRWLMEGDISRLEQLTIERVSRIHFRGGSYLGTSRANPTRAPFLLETALSSLERLEVGMLITIGGDDTAFSAMRLADAAGGRLRVVHVPKTIDNDLALPAPVDTFGYQTARSEGVRVVKNLMVDAGTTSRWYFIIAMGRKTGHLALGIGKAAGATVTLIPEEFGSEQIPLQRIVDTLIGAIIKRRRNGREDGVAVIAEGVVLGIREEDLRGMDDVERDDHDHLRIAEVSIGEILKDEVERGLKELGIRATVVAKNIGYELRCADPVPADMEYTRDLGYCAAKYLLEGGSNVMITMQGGGFVPIPFSEMLDAETGRTRIRAVTSTRYAIARRYMLRLRRDDFRDPEEVARLAAIADMTPEAFRARFEAVTANELPPIKLIQ
jgi:6-phosphofructokinase 1